METYFIALFKSTLNGMKVSGSNVGVEQRVYNAQQLAAKRVTAMANLPKTSHAGMNNPY